MTFTSIFGNPRGVSQCGAVLIVAIPGLSKRPNIRNIILNSRFFVKKILALFLIMATWPIYAANDIVELAKEALSLNGDATDYENKKDVTEKFADIKEFIQQDFKNGNAKARVDIFLLLDGLIQNNLSSLQSLLATNNNDIFAQEFGDSINYNSAEKLAYALKENKLLLTTEYVIDTQAAQGHCESYVNGTKIKNNNSFFAPSGLPYYVASYCDNNTFSVAKIQSESAQPKYTVRMGDFEPIQYKNPILSQEQGNDSSESKTPPHSMATPLKTETAPTESAKPPVVQEKVAPKIIPANITQPKQANAPKEAASVAKKEASPKTSGPEKASSLAQQHHMGESTSSGAFSTRAGYNLAMGWTQDSKISSFGLNYGNLAYLKALFRTEQFYFALDYAPASQDVSHIEREYGVENNLHFYQDVQHVSAEDVIYLRPQVGIVAYETAFSPNFTFLLDTGLAVTYVSGLKENNTLASKDPVVLYGIEMVPTLKYRLGPEFDLDFAFALGADAGENGTDYFMGPEVGVQVNF
jgi:hypothetical protein